MKNQLLACLICFTLTFSWSQEVDLEKIQNIALAEFYKTQSVPISDLISVNIHLFAINQKLAPNHFPKLSDSDVERFTRAVYGTTELTMFSYKLRAMEHINHGVANGLFSKELGAIYATFIDRSPTKKMVFAILKDFAAQPRNEQDMKSVALFKSVYLASDLYWPKPVKTRARCNPQLQVRIANCAGALFGAIVGSSLEGISPDAAAAVGAQGMAIFVAAQHENNGGRCI